MIFQRLVYYPEISLLRRGVVGKNLVDLTFLQVIAVSVLDSQCETRFVSWLCHRR